MYPISNALRTRFENGERKCARITLNNDRGDKVTITEADIVSDSLSIDRYCVTGDKIEIGSAVSAELSLVLNNNDGKFDDIRFEGSELKVEIGIKDVANSYIPCGYFTVDEPPRAFSKISLKALDFMMRFDNDADLTQIPFPCYVEDVVKIISALCGVTVSDNIDFDSLPNSKEKMYEPITTNITYRQILQWAAQVTGTCAYIDWNGELMLSWFETTDVNITPAVRYSGDILENDISITGVVIKTERGNFVSGTEDYTLDIDGNEIIDRDTEQSKADAVFSAVSGLQYRPYECSCIPMPYLYPLDKITYTDKNGNAISTVITNHTFGLNSTSAIAAQGETQQKKGYASQTSVSKKDVDKAIAEAIKNSDSTAEHLHIMYSAYEGGRDEDGNISWSTAPNANTVYLGTCTTNEKTGPDVPESYDWVKIKGDSPYELRLSQDIIIIKGSASGIPEQSVAIIVRGYEDGELVDTFLAGVKDLPDGMEWDVTKDDTIYEYEKAVCVANIKITPDLVSSNGHIRLLISVGDSGRAIIKFIPYVVVLDGEDGTPGLPGTNQYFHIRYSDDGINFTERNGEVLGEWMGTCVDNNEDDPEEFDAYTWHRIKGEQGVPGHDGIGIDGTSSYFHVRYSEVENPTAEQMTENPSKYIGTYVDNIEDDSDDPSDYKWVQFMGTNGIPGTNGTNGKTYYLHIKYSDDGGKTLTANNGETSGKYIGVYTDTTEADSTNVSSYTWSLLKGADGKDGQTTYTWIKYADSPTSGMSDNPEGKTYMGIAYNKTTKDESTTYSDYTWSLIKGEQGIPGEDGKSTYTWVKYADDDKGTNMSDSPTNKKYIGLAYNKSTSTESTTASDYTWALFRGEDGIDGQSQYFYVRYSANANGNPMTVEPDANTKYMGVCATTSATAPTSYTEYEWSQCKGDPGASQYVHVRFSAYSNGNNFTDKPNSTTEYMGVAVTTSSTAPTYYTDYVWTKIKGDQGVGTPGEKGDDGKTSYVHIKYSNNGTSFTDNNGEELGSWIGTYTDFNEADSTVFSDYTWKKFTDDVDSTLDDLDNRINDIVAEIIKMNDRLASLVTDENGYSLMEQSGDGWVFNIGGVTKEVNNAVSDIKDLSDSFSGVVSSVEGLSEAVDDLGKLASYVRVIEENGQPCIELGENDSDFKVKITNTDIKFMEGSTVVAYISNQALNIEKAVIKEEMQVGGFALKKRSNGNVGFMWKGES